MEEEEHEKKNDRHCGVYDDGARARHGDGRRYDYPPSLQQPAGWQRDDAGVRVVRRAGEGTHERPNRDSGVQQRHAGRRGFLSGAGAVWRHGYHQGRPFHDDQLC